MNKEQKRDLAIARGRIFLAKKQEGDSGFDKFGALHLRLFSYRTEVKIMVPTLHCATPEDAVTYIYDHYSENHLMWPAIKRSYMSLIIWAFVSTSFILLYKDE